MLTNWLTWKALCIAYATDLENQTPERVTCWHKYQEQGLDFHSQDHDQELQTTTDKDIYIYRIYSRISSKIYDKILS